MNDIYIWTKESLCFLLISTNILLVGFLDDGEYYHFKVLKKRREKYGTDENPSIGACLNNLGILYKTKGDHAKALEYYKLGLEIKRKTNATDKAIVISLNNVGITLSELGLHQQAKHILSEAFSIINKYPGFLSDCRDLSNDTLGMIYLHQRDYNNAIKYLTRGLHGRLKASPYHICVLEEQCKLAEAYYGLKEYHKARVALMETLEHKKVFIKQMPQNTFIYNSYRILMDIADAMNDRDNMEVNFIHCKAELYRLVNFFEDLGNLNKAQEMTENLGSVTEIYNHCKHRQKS